MPKYQFDLFVIGAGSGGVRAARISSQLGARVGICEDLRIGGTCVMRGCVPKKLLVYGVSFQELIEDAAACGWTVKPSNTSIDWEKLVAIKDRELERLEGVYHHLLKSSGVELFNGRGRLLDPHTVDVGGRVISAEKILIATGGWPSTPDLPGIQHVITSNEALDLKQLPKRMIIVGGGYIAVEFAGIFASAGVDVTEVIRAPNILRGFDEDVRNHLRLEMGKKGVTIRSETTIDLIEKADENYVVTLNSGEKVKTDLVMYATGRSPKTDDLGIEDLGVVLDEHRAIVVDEHYKTSINNIYALGDVTNRINLTPVAIGEAMVLANNLFNKGQSVMDYEIIPSAVFSHPPIGTVGLTEEEARGKYTIDVFVSTFRPMKHTLSGRNEQALMKLIVDQTSDRILGLHMVGPDSPEITQGFAAAMKTGITKAQLDTTVGIHPTAAEELVTMRQKTR